MNFNHLMEARLLKRKCRVNKTECYWMPVGNIRSTHGDIGHLTMYSKHCGVREDIFLSKQDYDTQEKMILKEIQSV